MTFQYKPATFECATLMFGIAGPTSSGKTMSALRLASGLSPDKPIFLIDTEQRRSLLYAKRFRFQHVSMEEPFSPQRYKEAIEFCVAQGAGAIIVDSMSHEHEGVGGVLEMQEQELNRMAGDDFGRREAMKFSAWIRPKAEHNRMLNSVVQKRAHMIFCFRAKDKLELVRKQNARGKWVMEPVSVGWTPICTDRFEYEMTAMLVLPPGSKGAPDLTARSTKLNDDLAAIFHDGEQITEAHGKVLRAWANGGDAVAGASEGAAVPPTETKQKARDPWADYRAKVGAALDVAMTTDEVHAIASKKTVTDALVAAPSAYRDGMQDDIAAAYARVRQGGEDAVPLADREPFIISAEIRHPVDTAPFMQKPSVDNAPENEAQTSDPFAPIDGMPFEVLSKRATSAVWKAYEKTLTPDQQVEANLRANGRVDEMRVTGG